MRKSFPGKIKRILCPVFAAGLFLALSGCSREELPESEATEKEAETSEVFSTEAVFETGAAEDIIFPGEEAEAALTYAEKTHEPEDVLTHYEQLFYVTAPLGVYLRQAPNSAAEILSEIPAGGGGNVVNQSTSGAWYYVTSGGLTGYVSAGSVITGIQAETLVEETAEERVRILSDTEVYADTGKKETLSSVKAAEVYDFLGEEAGLYLIRLSGKEEGYISKEAAEQGLFLTEAFNQPMNGLTVCLDPFWTMTDGEGEDPIAPESSETVPGFGSGAVGVESRLPEYSVNLAYARAVRDRLKERGYRVVMTRNSNSSSLGRLDRTCFCNDTGADLVIHLCCASSEDASSTGACVYFPDSSVGTALSEASGLFADVLSYMITQSGGECFYSVSSAFPELNYTENTAVVLRLGYLTTPEDDVKLNSEAYRELIAESVADALDRYYGFDQ